MAAAAVVSSVTVFRVVDDDLIPGMVAQGLRLGTDLVDDTGDLMAEGHGQHGLGRLLKLAQMGGQVWVSEPQIDE